MLYNNLQHYKYAARQHKCYNHAITIHHALLTTPMHCLLLCTIVLTTHEQLITQLRVCALKSSSFISSPRVTLYSIHNVGTQNRLMCQVLHFTNCNVHMQSISKPHQCWIVRTGIWVLCYNLVL